VRTRADIRALIVRIASPGGSVLGSDLIWREVVRTRAVKPVISSCGDVAASGGYYVALAGTPLLAEAGTITGSIGVLAGKANLRGLYERLGVNKELVTRGRNAALYSEPAPLDDEGRARSCAGRYVLSAPPRWPRRAGSATPPRGGGRKGVWTGRQGSSAAWSTSSSGIEEAFAAASEPPASPPTSP
jgi:protease-4